MNIAFLQFRYEVPTYILNVLGNLQQVESIASFGIMAVHFYTVEPFKVNIWDTNLSNSKFSKSECFS